jgi:hypothetical protein
MKPEEIVSVLLNAAAFLKKPVQDVAGQSIKDGYDALKAYLKRKIAGGEATEALEKATDKPDSAGRKAVLLEESATIDLGGDADLVRLAESLAGLLAHAGQHVRQRVVVQGDGNHVQVAGRDIIYTKKHVQRNEITPDERHITGDQKEQLRVLNTELAQRVAGEDGKPDYSAGFRALQKHFGVSSYLLIPREKFEEALSLLKQRRAMNRSKLRNRNPTAYSGDFFRSIYSRAGELGWERPQVYQYAFDRLALKKPITSLKQLGPIQLKTLSEFMQREVKKHRSADDTTVRD